jgi:hypothetical protein
MLSKAWEGGPMPLLLYAELQTPPRVQEELLKGKQYSNLFGFHTDNIDTYALTTLCSLQPSTRAFPNTDVDHRLTCYHENMIDCLAKVSKQHMLAFGQLSFQPRQLVPRISLPKHFR